MVILGISAFYHDSAAALVRDGEIIAAAQEERFTRKKHDSRFPSHAVEFCLAQGGVRLSDLDFVARHADMIGFSFVQSADDIALMQNELAKRRPDWQRLGIVAKVETAQAVKNLPEIIVRAAGRQPFGVMIARGHLAVAFGFERLAEMQEEILWLCEAAHVPVIWATQVLEEMVKSGLPTRGEMTDAAMAARAECVMLNKGPNVGDAITALRGLLHRMMEHQSKKTARLRALRSW